MIDQLLPPTPAQSADILVSRPVHCGEHLDVNSNPNSPSIKNARATLSRFTRAEVQNLLREAYNIITEKDKELTFAAKLRNKVLEENESLKTKCEEMMDYLSEHGFFVAEPEGSDHMEIVEKNQLQNTPVNTIHPIRPMSRRQSTRLEEENMSGLEMINAELQSRLEAAIKENAALRKKDERKVRSLEADIRGLRTELEMATQTIEQLEDRNREILQRKKVDRNEARNEAVDEQFVDQLIHQVSHLEEQNSSIDAQKSELEVRLNEVLKGLEEARLRIEELEEVQHEYNELQVAFERQSMHVAELSQSVEEQRSWIQNVFNQTSPRSVPGTFNLQANFSSPKANLNSAIFNSLSSTNSPAGTSQVSMRKRCTLLSELESEWYRNVTGQPLTNSTKVPSSELISSTPKILESTVIDSNLNSPSLDSIASPNSHSVSASYLRDIFSQEEKSKLLSGYTEEANYGAELQDDDDLSGEETENVEESVGWFGYITNSIKGALSYTWKWCRFIFLLFTAVVVALYRGPNGYAL
ncbi:hypothetical protein K493DRAFT_342509 [Basidiobolus meristosporus CBS 931.73]|uniref:Uncharacterized protein n=1 Tax=Basidiobolus meristosporus CBS 931.73 TaxID=1314790 RepID=A0A1Y1X4N3_9FUNG|nr:hypothetical protein K493DRAFT_342509 [Basidiobolus meristosporus CBS 931.73]|eukprot:ORX80743.1 hypothetical protein K493DRAFT_342509 [Basidiobolus meristosporus CBS 931.73]